MGVISSTYGTRWSLHIRDMPSGSYYCTVCTQTLHHISHTLLHITSPVRSGEDLRLPLDPEVVCSYKLVLVNSSPRLIQEPYKLNHLFVTHKVGGIPTHTIKNMSMSKR